MKGDLHFFEYVYEYGYCNNSLFPDGTMTSTWTLKRPDADHWYCVAAGNMRNKK